MTEPPDFESLLGRAAVGLAQFDTLGRHILVNAPYCKMIGLSSQELTGRPLREILPPLSSSLDSPLVAAVYKGADAHVAREIFTTRAGASLPVEYWIRPILNAGKFVGSVGTFIDLRERKDAELSYRELAHRIRNIFAIAQAVVGQTLRGIGTPRETVHAINQRLAALSSANTLIMRRQIESLPVVDVVDNAVAMHRLDPNRIKLAGTEVEMGTKSALAVSLALHELCTNAARYGALSNDVGVVEIAWTVVPAGDGDDVFRLTWAEHSGPPVDPHARRGFGARLIVESVSSDVRGRAELSFDKAGVRWFLEAPISALAE